MSWVHISNQPNGLCIGNKVSRAMPYIAGRQVYTGWTDTKHGLYPVSLSLIYKQWLSHTGPTAAWCRGPSILAIQYRQTVGFQVCRAGVWTSTPDLPSRWRRLHSCPTQPPAIDLSARPIQEAASYSWLSLTEVVIVPESVVDGDCPWHIQYSFAWLCLCVPYHGLTSL